MVLEKMSYAELSDMERQIERIKIEKQNAERQALRDKVTALAKQHGFTLEELFGKGRAKGGKVAVKYRDPKNPAEYLDRPRPHAALDGRRDQGRKARKEDFLI